jgi:hypothetical protein
VTAPPPGTVVAAPPPRTLIASTPGVVTAPVTTSNTVRMYGRVSDIESNGTVKVRLADGSSVHFRPPAGTVYRKNDPVTLDMTVGAPAPSALPR